MHPDDQLTEWLVRWEDAQIADGPPPTLDQLPTELRPHARAGQNLVRGFARMAHGLVAARPAPPADPPPVPADTSRYQFEAFLGRGGMADVWRGRDTLLGREVALKVLREPVFGDGAARVRFEEEARHVSQMGHPSIVPVYDLGELSDGRPFFAMKLVLGQTLAELLAARATPADDRARWVRVFEQICAAVAYAHARDLIHRDLKPSNIMLGEFGEVQVMDWGIAKTLTAEPEPPPVLPAQVSPSALVGQSATRRAGPESLSGLISGTPAFMAPEQARGEARRIGKASDVFGLGGILSVILTGQPPYIHSREAMAGDLTAASARLDGCGADAELIGLAKACLAPVPELRPADAGEIVGRVTRYRDDVAARQAEADRVMWLRHATQEASELFSPAVEDARARLRQQAAALIRDEVAAQAPRLSSASPAEATAARQVLEALRVLPVLAGVRDPAAMATLPEPERQTWRALWAELEGLLSGPVPVR
jgi:tRNA A-37 threonylcarbamoyl transferase component Bud32